MRGKFPRVWGDFQGCGEILAQPSCSDERAGAHRYKHTAVSIL